MSASARAFAGRIPGLSETGPDFWEAEGGADVSYPAGGHTGMAAIERESYWFNHRNALIASTVARFPPDGTIVDIGGGNGYVSLGLREAGFDSLVVEPGPAGAGCARERGIPVIRAPFETLDVPAGAIPAAGLFDVIEHIPDDAGAMRALHAGMAEGAMLYATVPAYGWLWSTEDVHAGHFRRYTLPGFVRLLESGGFTVSYASYFFAMLVPPVFAARALPSRLGLTNAERPADTAGDHSLPGGPVGTVLQKCLDWEKDRVAAGRTVPFGTSCLVAARRR